MMAELRTAISLVLSLPLSRSRSRSHSHAKLITHPLIALSDAMRLWTGNNHVAEFEQGQKSRPSPSYLIDLFPISTGNENGSAGPGPVT